MILAAVNLYSLLLCLVLAISRKAGHLAIVRPDRGEAMRDSEYELLSILLPRTSVNKGKKRGPPPQGGASPGYNGTTLLMCTLVTRKTLVPIRWAVIPDCALTPPLRCPRARPWLGCCAHCLESALLPAGHDNGNTVTFIVFLRSSTTMLLFGVRDPK
jgi:hypothetical protein